jgi:hypothetical protein
MQIFSLSLGLKLDMFFFPTLPCSRYWNIGEIAVVKGKEGCNKAAHRL